ncbi:ABC transporter ATP-binding protein [Puia sp.]|jgi:ABC-2 type transport system ATP-binding protein|uniref:ABC transporter ATP-binding protein n=1 Tax=Puia sp. TaxID=2045100 RepID=UPI002F3F9C4C
MIRVQNLSFGYKKGTLLYENLDLSLDPGNICGLLGKNGAGKSTFLKTLVGLLFPQSGSISINGFEPRKRQPSFLETIYFIPEEVTVPSLTIGRYLNLFASFYPQFDENLFYNCLKVLEVKPEGKLRTLSFGQQKKFAIAFGLACNTTVLLLDEPTNGMDIPSKTQFRKLISSVFSKDRLLLISTHQVRDLDNLIDQIVIVDNGRLLLNTSMAEVTEKLCFKSLYHLPEERVDDVLYSEESLKGVSVVMRNLENQDSKVNLEHLFNAVTAQPALTKEIFAN